MVRAAAAACLLCFGLVAQQPQLQRVGVLFEGAAHYYWFQPCIGFQFDHLGNITFLYWQHWCRCWGFVLINLRDYSHVIVIDIYNEG